MCVRIAAADRDVVQIGEVAGLSFLTDYTFYRSLEACDTVGDAEDHATELI